MKSNRILSTIITLLLANQALAATEIRLATHDSFDLPKELIAEFEQKNDAKISIIKAGDGNELLNKLIISKRKPIADVVYGLDNGNILKANAENLYRCPMRWRWISVLWQSITIKNGLKKKDWHYPKHWLIWQNPNTKVYW